MNVMAFSHNELKWLKLTNNLSVTSWILWPSATMSCNGWRSQITSLWLHECYGLEPEWAVMAEGHSIWKVTEWLFVTRACHSLLWLKVTTFEKWQRGNLWRKATTDCCGWRTQHLKSDREAICCQRLPQFVVAERHSIWKVTERLFIARGSPQFTIPWSHCISYVT